MEASKSLSSQGAPGLTGQLLSDGLVNAYVLKRKDEYI